MKISGKGNRANLTINGKRCGISIDVGPWIESVNPPRRAGPPARRNAA
jgi:hypothetical protein